MQNLKKLNPKIPNPKNLAFISIAAFVLAFGACNADIDKPNTNPLTDKSKHIYHPQTRDELVELLRDENIKLDTIDTSSITDMSFLFSQMKSMCDDIPKELVGYEHRCKNTARDRKDFSGIEGWDTSSVEDMTLMFAYIKSLNQSLESWDVSSVKNMQGMFFYAQSFNQPLDKWDINNVEDMWSMFVGAESFRQNLDAWNTRNVKKMDDMFIGSPLQFNPPKWYKEWRKNKKVLRQESRF